MTLPAVWSSEGCYKLEGSGTLSSYPTTIIVLRMDQYNLKDAAEQGNIDALYSLIAMEPKVLDNMDEIPFVETPLHVAAAAGQTEFVMEMMILKPSFARKLNPNGFTPLLLAMHNNHTQLVCDLLAVHKDLVCAQGRGGMNPLHYAAQTRNLCLLATFLRFCPKYIKDVTSRSETAMHIALKNDMFDAFQLLVGWLRRAWFEKARYYGMRLLNWRDLNGNTVLHIAASKNELQASSSHYVFY
jgi:ankyrin repeat protein